MRAVDKALHPRFFNLQFRLFPSLPPCSNVGGATLAIASQLPDGGPDGVVELGAADAIFGRLCGCLADAAAMGATQAATGDGDPISTAAGVAFPLPG